MADTPLGLDRLDKSLFVIMAFMSPLIVIIYNILFQADISRNSICYNVVDGKRLS